MWYWVGRLLLLSLVAFLVAPGVRARQATSIDSGLGNLPPGTSYEPIVDATIENLLAVSPLVGIARLTFSPPKASTGQMGYADDRTEGPTLFFVEEGSLALSTGGSIGVHKQGPVLLRRGVASPVVVTDSAAVQLGAGDVVMWPKDVLITVGLFGNDPAVALAIQIFPRGATEAGEFGGVVTEPLDLDLGVPTALPPAPPGMVLGRLILAAGASIEIGGDEVPRLLLVEWGAVEVAPTDLEVPVLPVERDPNQPVIAVAAGAVGQLAAGDAVFVPFASTTAIGTGGEAASLLVLSVVPEIAAEATPSP